MSPFSDNEEEGGGGTYWFPSLDHGEETEGAKRKDMGDVWGGRRTGGSGNTVGEDLHMETARNRGSVGGAMSYILGACKGNRIRRGRAQEGSLEATRGIRETTTVHPGSLAVR